MSCVVVNMDFHHRHSTGSQGERQTRIRCPNPRYRRSPSPMTVNKTVHNSGL